MPEKGPSVPRPRTHGLSDLTSRPALTNVYISMLRGINVGGKNKVKMDELRELYRSMGFENVRIYVQSGNVVFESPVPDAAELQKRIQRKIGTSLGFEVAVMIRTKDEFRQLIRDNPFGAKDENHLYVTFLSEEPPSLPAEEIDPAKGKGEEYSIRGRAIYLFLPNGYGRTKLSNNFLERKLGVSATTRNWRTVNALLLMAET